MGNCFDLQLRGQLARDSGLIDAISEYTMFMIHKKNLGRIESFVFHWLLLQETYSLRQSHSIGVLHPGPDDINYPSKFKSPLRGIEKYVNSRPKKVLALGYIENAFTVKTPSSDEILEIICNAIQDPERIQEAKDVCAKLQCLLIENRIEDITEYPNVLCNIVQEYLPPRRIRMINKHTNFGRFYSCCKNFVCAANGDELRIVHLPSFQLVYKNEDKGYAALTWSDYECLLVPTVYTAHEWIILNLNNGSQRLFYTDIGNELRYSGKVVFNKVLYINHEEGIYKIQEGKLVQVVERGNLMHDGPTALLMYTQNGKLYRYGHGEVQMPDNGHSKFPEISDGKQVLRSNYTNHSSSVYMINEKKEYTIPGLDNDSGPITSAGFQNDCLIYTIGRTTRIFRNGEVIFEIPNFIAEVACDDYILGIDTNWEKYALYSCK
jgi:hypothetical protein